MLWVDRYGNAQLNVDPDEVDDFGDRVRLRVRRRRARLARRADHLRRDRRGESAWSSTPTACCRSSLDRHPAAAELGLAAGDEVTSSLRRGDAAGADGVTSPVPVGIGHGGAPMRKGTTITLAVLLLVILGAAVLQLFFLAR